MPSLYSYTLGKIVDSSRVAATLHHRRGESLLYLFHKEITSGNRMIEEAEQDPEWRWELARFLRR